MRSTEKIDIEKVEIAVRNAVPENMSILDSIKINSVIREVIAGDILVNGVIIEGKIHVSQCLADVEYIVFQVNKFEEKTVDVSIIGMALQADQDEDDDFSSCLSVNFLRDEKIEYMTF